MNVQREVAAGLELKERVGRQEHVVGCEHSKHGLSLTEAFADISGR